MHQLLFFAHELQMLLLEIMRKIFQNPPVLHQVKSLGSTVWVPKFSDGLPFKAGFDEISEILVWKFKGGREGLGSRGSFLFMGF